MALETGTYISDLVVTNPTATDPKAEGDDHVRLIKSTVKATFPNITGAVTATQVELNTLDGITASTAELNILDGVTASTAELNILDGVTATASELNVLDGITASTAELNIMDGVTVTAADINTVTLKANINSPTFTGTPLAPTPTLGDSSTKIATTAFVASTAFSAVLPAQTGNSGKLITTDGTNASWSAIKTINGTTLLGAGDIVAGGYVLLSTATASASVAVDFTSSVVNSTYDEYVVVATNVVTTPAASHGWRLSTDGGSTWIATNYAHQSVTYNGITVTASQNASNSLVSSPYTATDPFTIVFRLYSANSSTLKMMDVYGIRGAISANLAFYNTAAALNATSAINGIRFVATSNDIDSGTFKLYGVKK